MQSYPTVEASRAPSPKETLEAFVLRFRAFNAAASFGDWAAASKVLEQERALRGVR